MKRPEEELHKTVAGFLWLSLPPTVVWTTIAHGAYLGNEMITVRGGKQIPARVLRATRLKEMGVANGWPDILLLNHNPHAYAAGFCRVFGLELKTATGSVSGDQKSVHKAILSVGGIVYVCRSLDDVVAALAAEKITLRSRL